MYCCLILVYKLRVRFCSIIFLMLRCSDGWILKWARERGVRVEDWALRRYVISLYSSIVTLTNTGFGDRYPMNTKERIFSIVTMIVGFLVFGYGLSLLSATITHADSFRFGYYFSAVINVLLVKYATGCTDTLRMFRSAV